MRARRTPFLPLCRCLSLEEATAVDIEANATALTTESVNTLRGKRTRKKRTPFGSENEPMKTETKRVWKHQTAPKAKAMQRDNAIKMNTVVRVGEGKRHT